MRLTKTDHMLMTPETGASRHPEPCPTPEIPTDPQADPLPLPGLGGVPGSRGSGSGTRRPTFLSLCTRAGDSLPQQLPDGPATTSGQESSPGAHRGWWGCRGGGGGRRLGGGRGQTQGEAGGGWPGSIPRLTARHDSGTNRKNHTYHLYTCERF